MLIIALALAVIGLAALVFAVVTSNALVAWVCIGASVLGVLLLISDALRERRHPDTGPVEQSDAGEPESAEAQHDSAADEDAEAADDDAADDAADDDADATESDAPDGDR